MWQQRCSTRQQTATLTIIVLKSRKPFRSKCLALVPTAQSRTKKSQLSGQRFMTRWFASLTSAAVGLLIQEVQHEQNTEFSQRTIHRKTRCHPSFVGNCEGPNPNHST